MHQAVRRSGARVQRHARRAQQQRAQQRRQPPQAQPAAAAAGGARAPLVQVVVEGVEVGRGRDDLRDREAQQLHDVDDARELADPAPARAGRDDGVVLRRQAAGVCRSAASQGVSGRQARKGSRSAHSHWHRTCVTRVRFVLSELVYQLPSLICGRGVCSIAHGKQQRSKQQRSKQQVLRRCAACTRWRAAGHTQCTRTHTRTHAGAARTAGHPMGKASPRCACTPGTARSAATACRRRSTPRKSVRRCRASCPSWPWCWAG